MATILGKKIQIALLKSGGDMSLTVTGQLADTPTRGLPTRGQDDSRTGHLADWPTPVSYTHLTLPTNREV